MENIFNKEECNYIYYLNRFISKVVDLRSSTLSRNVFINDNEYLILFNYSGNVDGLSTSYFVNGSLIVEDEDNKRKIMVSRREFAYDLDSDGNETSIKYLKNGDLVSSKESNFTYSKIIDGEKIFTNKELEEIGSVIEDILNKTSGIRRKKTLQDIKEML